jgi:hypothetical protein
MKNKVTQGTLNEQKSFLLRTSELRNVTKQVNSHEEKGSSNVTQQKSFHHSNKRTQECDKAKSILMKNKVTQKM